MADTYAVEVKELTRKFGAFTAVDRVTFHVRKGEIFGFLGPNGAGKTTTIKMLTGLISPSSGKGTVSGFDIATQAESIKLSIGYMSQLFSLYADLSVEENIRFFSGLYGVSGAVREARTQWVLEMAGLTDQRRRLTGDLPLGWKQRLALGCAVIHEPPVLFLDEPTSGVDPISRRNFWDLIYTLAGGGTTVFVSTHYMEEAEYCQRLALMNRGRLVALDTPAKLRGSMSEPLLEIRTDSGPAAVELIRDLPGVLEAGLFGRAVHVTVENAQVVRPRLEECLREHSIEWESIDAVVPSLEDVFIAKIRAEGGAVSG